MARVWIFLDSKQVKQVGEDQASWCVGWYDPEGKRCSKSCGAGSAGKKAAKKLQEKRQAELLTGTYQAENKKTWAEFRARYDAKIVTNMKPRTRRLVHESLGQFERLIKPGKVATIRTTTIDDFIALRRAMTKSRKKPKPTEAGPPTPSAPVQEPVSVATVNKDLRHIKAALRVAHDWSFLPVVPKFRFLKEPGKLPTYISPTDFALLYEKCDVATMPALAGIDTADWWRGLLAYCYLTGWRISEVMSLRRADVDLDAGTALTRAEDNKGGRDELARLHPIVVAHLRKLPGFDPYFFPWPHDNRTLYSEFGRIQVAAAVKPAGKKQYGFHDLRRAFASLNADRLTADALQKLMRHKSYLTTKRYINMTRQLDQAVDALHVPDVLKKVSG